MTQTASTPKIIDRGRFGVAIDWLVGETGHFDSAMPSKETAEELLRRWNAHEALVEALRLCKQELQYIKDGSLGGVPLSITSLIPERIEQAEAALALAEAR
jgi:hypothetical protein